ANAEAGQQPEADFFRVTAWRQLGENCNRYLAKGRKVAVVGSVQVNTYTAGDGTTRASLEVTADEVEFLSPRGEGDGGSGYQAEQSPSQSSGGTNSGFVKVDDEELPF
ncbi:MAG: single-stranded DNA-binding protein, partial [Clostridiales bacterium]|nr:single-stranded DNA-binding protein [Clostridiales bacterium]